MTERPEIILQRDHTEPENGYHDWVMLGDHIWAAKDGSARGGGGTTLWLIAVCNNIECPARALVWSFAADRIIREALNA